MGVPIGCHLSVSKGTAQAVDKVHAMGGTAFQYFGRNPRSLRYPSRVTPKQAEATRERERELGVVAIAHAPYLVNLSAPDRSLWEAGVRALKEDLGLTDALGTVGMVVHCGKPKDEGAQVGIARMREALGELCEVTTTTRVLLENTARQGSEIGYHLEQLLEIVDGFPLERVGFCLDTCHAFAAAWMDETDPVSAFEDRAFTERLGAVHLNDSMFPYGSRRDRHARLGQGTMGLPLLARFLAWPVLQEIPVVLETPIDREEEYEPEIRWSRARMEGVPWEPGDGIDLGVGA